MDLFCQFILVSSSRFSRYSNVMTQVRTFLDGCYDFYHLVCISLPAIAVSCFISASGLRAISTTLKLQSALDCNLEFALCVHLNAHRVQIHLIQFIYWMWSHCITTEYRNVMSCSASLRFSVSFAYCFDSISILPSQRKRPVFFFFFLSKHSRRQSWCECEVFSPFALDEMQIDFIVPTRPAHVVLFPSVVRNTFVRGVVASLRRENSISQFTCDTNIQKIMYILRVSIPKWTSDRCGLPRQCMRNAYTRMCVRVWAHQIVPDTYASIAHEHGPHRHVHTTHHSHKPRYITITLFAYFMPVLWMLCLTHSEVVVVSVASIFKPLLHSRSVQANNKHFVCISLVVFKIFASNWCVPHRRSVACCRLHCHACARHSSAISLNPKEISLTHTHTYTHICGFTLPVCDRYVQ